MNILKCFGIISPINFSTACSNHGDSTYEIEEGILYLTDGTQRIYNVKMKEKHHPLLQGSVKEFFDILTIADDARFKSNGLRPVKLKDVINGCNTVKRHLYKYVESYAFSHGFKPFEIGNDKLYPILQKISQMKNFDPLNGVWVNSDEGRKLVAEALLTQENAILDQIPEKTLKCAKLLRSYLESLLDQKGLSYEKVVKQFDWSSGKPLENSIDGSYVIAKLIAQADAWAALQSKKAAKNFPFKEIWRFNIDKSKEEFGPYIFENEPFYALANLRGLKEILLSESPMCQKTYEVFATVLMNNPPILHDSIFLNWDNSMLMGPNKDHVFFNTKMEKGRGRCFEIGTHIQDEIGLSDLNKRHEEADKASVNTKKDRKYWIANATGFTTNTFELGSQTNTTCTLIAQRIFLGCEQMLTNAKTPGERLMAYIWTARELEITHQLPDGNGRTSIATLIKSIVEDKDLPNYIPENPNILDFLAPEAIIRQVYSGMLRFKELSQESSEIMIDVEELVDQAKVRGQTWNVVHARAELPHVQIKKLVAEDRIVIDSIEQKALKDKAIKKAIWENSLVSLEPIHL